MRIRTKSLAIIGATALFCSACGSDNSDAADTNADRQAVVDWMLAQDETQESAECFADQLSQYKATDFEAFDAAESLADAPEGMADDVMAAAQVCVDG